jgi:hypothetical protein
MSATNRGAKRSPQDDYSTPAWCVHAILPHLRLWDGFTVLDPCAGQGNLLEAVLVYAKRVDADIGDVLGIEINSKRAKALGFDHRDALTEGKWFTPKPNLIITNPPFSLAMEFLTRSLAEVAKDGEVAFLLRLNWLGSAERAEFHRTNPCDVYVLPRRPEFILSAKCSPKKKGCGFQWTQSIHLARPTQCRKCKKTKTLSISTTDATEYAWFCFGRDRGTAHPIAGRSHRLFILGDMDPSEVLRP